MGISVNSLFRQVKDLGVPAVTVDGFRHKAGFLKTDSPVIFPAMGAWRFGYVVAENHKDGDFGKPFKITLRNGHALQRAKGTG